MTYATECWNRYRQGTAHHRRQKAKAETIARATSELTARWHEQCELFPTMRDDIPLARYLHVNLPTAVRNIENAAAVRREQLESPDGEPSIMLDFRD